MRGLRLLPYAGRLGTTYMYVYERGRPTFSDSGVVWTQIDLAATAHHCEAMAGRERHERWGPRTLDVDVLAYGDVVSNDPVLTLPHPRATERAFVLVPWAAVDPAFVVAGQSVADWAAAVDASGVRPFAEVGGA